MNATEKNATESSLPSEQRIKREKSTLTKVLPTDRIAFDKQVKILQAFAACYQSNGGKAVSCKLAGETVTPKFSESTLLVAVPFFTDVGLLTRNGGDFVPCPELVAYNQAVTFSVSEAKRKLRPVFERAWFCTLLSPRLQLNPLPLKDCVGILAVEATAAEEHTRRVEPLINFLELAGIVSVAGATVSLAPLQGETTRPESKGPQDIPNIFTEVEEHHLFLDKDRLKKVVFSCPLFITKSEYNRICNWIKAAWIIEDPENDEPGSKG